MTVPSNEELQRLLDASTPGDWQFQDHEEWEHVAGPEYPPQKVMIAHGVEVDGVPLFGQANDDLLEDYPGNLRIAALSRVLAAEVIRLREENDEMRRGIATAAEKARSHATQCSSMGQAAGSLGHREIARHLARILEGDQA